MQIENEFKQQQIELQRENQQKYLERKNIEVTSDQLSFLCSGVRAADKRLVGG